MTHLKEYVNAKEGPRPIQSPVMRRLVQVIRRAWEVAHVLLRAWEAVRRPQKAVCDFVASAIAGPLARLLLRMSGCLAPEPNLVERLTVTLADRLLGAALDVAVAALI
jgi:hypothetical protein